MGQTANQIESHIATERDELRHNLDVLDEKVREAVTWQEQFKTRPRMMLGIAFGIGVVLAHVIPNGRRDRLR